MVLMGLLILIVRPRVLSFVSGRLVAPFSAPLALLVAVVVLNGFLDHPQSQHLLLLQQQRLDLLVQ